jgi:hypothetical protein
METEISETRVQGAKKGGTREQCSQKLFELAEIFRKIIKIYKNW